MAYVVVNNEAEGRVPNIAVGSEQSGFEFSKAIDGNPSTGFKNGSGTQPKVIIPLTGITFDTIAAYASRESSFTFSVKYTTTSNVTDPNDSSWVNFVADKAGSNVGSGNALSFNTISGSNAKMMITNTPLINVRGILLTFSSMDTTLDILQYFVIGDSYKIPISAPFNPPTFGVVETINKMNNKGAPLIQDVKPIPSKIRLNLRNQSESDMATHITNLKGIQNNPFFLTAGSDLLVHNNQSDAAYFCIVDKGLSQPRYTNPTTMSWSFNLLGYQ